MTTRRVKQGVTTTKAAPRPRKPPTPPIDKRAAILDAALTEFVECGFVAASTNAIAARAHVAKGLVFHHFGSKEALLQAVLDDVTAQITPHYLAYLQDAPPDVFARLLGWMEAKLAILARDPRHVRVFLTALRDAPDDVRTATLAKSAHAVTSLLPRLFEGVDWSGLRPGLHAHDAIAALRVLMAGLEHEVLQPSHHAHDLVIDDAVAHARRMFAILRTGLFGA